MIKSNPNQGLPRRRSIRLKGYDYSQNGLYFITICCQNRERLFGKIQKGKLILNDAGKMIENEWMKLQQRFENIRLHQYIIMPDHFHAILEIANPPNESNNQNKNPVSVPATLVVAPILASSPTLVVAPILQKENGQPQGIDPTEKSNKKTIGDILSAFKSITTVEYIRGVKNKNWPRFNKKLWQRNYWEHIIRNEKAYNNISEYIKNNPKKWNG